MSDDNNTVLKAYPAIMQKLENMLSIKEARCMDNAAGCVSRLITPVADYTFRQATRGHWDPHNPAWQALWCCVSLRREAPLLRRCALGSTISC